MCAECLGRSRAGCELTDFPVALNMAMHLDRAFDQPYLPNGAAKRACVNAIGTVSNRDPILVPAQMREPGVKNRVPTLQRAHPLAHARQNGAGSINPAVKNVFHETTPEEKAIARYT
jgi:hypothetical protein